LDNKPNYYSVTPASVRYSQKLCPNSKLLYGELTALCNDKGFCWASNSYFAKLYEVHVGTISKWITQLSRNDHISVIVENENERKIYIHEKMKPPTPNGVTPLHDLVIDPTPNDVHNTTYNNTINNTKNTGLRPRDCFSIPTIIELTEYCKMRKNNVDPQNFLDFYEAKGWMIGKNKMKNWQAAVRTWEKNDGSNKNTLKERGIRDL